MCQEKKMLSFQVSTSFAKLFSRRITSRNCLEIIYSKQLDPNPNKQCVFGMTLKRMLHCDLTLRTVNPTYVFFLFSQNKQYVFLITHI
jgi:hypothetical protein